MKRKFLEAIVLCTLSMCFLFGVMEAYFRLLNPQTMRLSRPDPVLGWLPIPNTASRLSKSCFSATASFNREAMRDVNHALAKPSGVYRIAVLGDSFVAGMEVNFEDTFFRQLQAKLNQQGLNTEVLGFGVRGFGTDQEYLLLKKHAIQYDPDLVILAFYQRDINDNLLGLNRNPAKPYFGLSKQGTLVQKPFQPMRDHTNSWKSFLFTNFHTFRFLYFKLSEIPIIHNALVKFGIYANIIPTPQHSLDLMDNSIFIKEWPEQWEQAWSITKAIILEIKRETEKHDADFILFSLTRALQISDDEFRKFRAQYPQFDLERDRVEKRLELFSRENGIVYVPSLPYMKSLEEKGMPVHLSCDAHWTKEAHREAAEILSGVIVESGWIRKVSLTE